MDEFGVVTASRLHDPGPEIAGATSGYREGSDFLVRVIGLRLAATMLRASLTLMRTNEHELGFQL
jgi:hypothetical protein